MADEGVLVREDARMKIRQLEDVIRNRNNTIEELNEIAETSKMFCQLYRKENQTLEQQNILMRATLEYIAFHKMEPTNNADWAVQTAQDALAELNRGQLANKI